MKFVKIPNFSGGGGNYMPSLTNFIDGNAVSLDLCKLMHEFVLFGASFSSMKSGRACFSITNSNHEQVKGK